MSHVLFSLHQGLRMSCKHLSGVLDDGTLWADRVGTYGEMDQRLLPKSDEP